MNMFEEAVNQVSEKELVAADKGFAGNKIEESGIFLVQITMAKQVDSGSSNSKNFKLEMETEKKAKLYWDAGWYINKTGTHLDKNGKILTAASSLAKNNSLIMGTNNVPVLSAATIKEYDFDLKTEVDVERMVSRDMVGKFVKVKVVRSRINKKVNSGRKGPDGYDIWVDGPEERFVNEIKCFYDATTGQTFAEKHLGKEAGLIIKDEEYCIENPVLDKFKEVAGTAAAAAPISAPAAGGFGS